MDRPVEERTGEPRRTPCQQPGSREVETRDGDFIDQAYADDWFEDPGVGADTPERARRQHALHLCHFECLTVTRLACLREGMKPENLPFGIWGGHTEAERQIIHKGIQSRQRRQPFIDN